MGAGTMGTQLKSILMLNDGHWDRSLSKQLLLEFFGRKKKRKTTIISCSNKLLNSALTF